MSDWIPRDEIVPPPWVFPDEDVEEDPVNITSAVAAIVISSSDRSDVSVSAGSSISYEGMLIGVGISFSFATVAVGSVVVIRW